MSEIPSESRAKGTVFKKSAPGTRGSATPIEDYLATQVESPRIADDAKQKFTEQDVKINELVGSTGLSANKAARPFIRALPPPSSRNAFISSQLIRSSTPSLVVEFL